MEDVDPQVLVASVTERIRWIRDRVDQLKGIIGNAEQLSMRYDELIGGMDRGVSVSWTMSNGDNNSIKLEGDKAREIRGESARIAMNQIKSLLSQFDALIEELHTK